MSQERPSPLGKLFPFSLRDFWISAALLFGATAICILLRSFDSSDANASLIFLLAVVLISRLTNGYAFGVVSSFLAVFGVNYIFTYPYLAFNFTLAGYPITFLTMLGVSILICALTTRIKQQERLRTENEKEKMRANLLRSVSHDIRTPLTSIVGATSAVLDNEEALTPAQKRSLLEDVREDAQWLIRIVENLLSITRIGGEAAQITKAEEAAEEILAETVRKFRKRFPAVCVTVEVPDELLLVPMDAILIEQVLTNLMENAAIHGKTASEICVCAQQEAGWGRFSVRDNGVGISKALLPEIFSGSLTHAEGKTADNRKRNMGMGLPVCSAIVKAHNGSIHARNLPDGGAEFYFLLPLGEEEIR